MIKEISILVNGDLVETLTSVVSEYDVTENLITGDNEVTLVVTDTADNILYDDYAFCTKTASSIITPPTSDVGCNVSLMNLFFLFIGFGVLFLKRKEVI